MGFLGMDDADQVRHVGHQLQTKSDEAKTLAAAIDQLVQGLDWHGQDAETFKHQWWPEHRQFLVQVAHDLHGLGQSAINNAQEQIDASGR